MQDKQYKYVYGIGKTALDIPESEIRYAMENTKSNAEAARFLKISFTTYKKYARLYTDRDTGKTLYELHKNQFGVGITKDVKRPQRVSTPLITYYQVSILITHLGSYVIDY